MNHLRPFLSFLAAKYKQMKHYERTAMNIGLGTFFTRSTQSAIIKQIKQTFTNTL